MIEPGCHDAKRSATVVRHDIIGNAAATASALHHDCTTLVTLTWAVLRITRQAKW